MKKSLLFLFALVAGALTHLLADDHREREKEHEREEPRRELREKQDRMHRESREIHEAVRAGKISHEDGREKLEALNRKHHEHEKERFWKRVEEEIEGAVPLWSDDPETSGCGIRANQKLKSRRKKLQGNCIEKLKKE